MSEFLLIHYKPEDSSSLQYWALGGDNHPSITLAHGSMDDLVPVAKGKKIYVLIDAHHTTLAALSIPSKNRAKQLQAIPFAMEDLLAEDIDDIHFALGKQTDDSNVPVIAIKKTLIEQIINDFSKHGISIDAITADNIAIEGSSENWGVLLTDNNALIKTGEGQTHSCDKDNLAIILQALLDQAETRPESITCSFKEDDADAAAILEELAPENLELDVKQNPFKNHPLEIFVRHLSAINSFNILQGEFTPKRESSLDWLLPWKAVASIAAVWMTLHLAYAGIHGNQLQSQNLELNKLIEREFKRAIPDARKITNMQKRVERRLNELKTGGGSNNERGFLQILAKVSPVLADNKTIDIKAAVYRNNYIDVDLSAKKLQDIEQIKTQLLKIPGIKVVLSTTIEKDAVKGRLRMEAQG